MARLQQHGASGIFGMATLRAAVVSKMCWGGAAAAMGQQERGRASRETKEKQPTAEGAGERQGKCWGE